MTGTSGSGKTTYWLHRLRDWPARYKWALETSKGEISRSLGWPLVFAPNQLAWSVQTRTPVAFDPSRMFPGNRIAGFEFLCLWVWNVSQELQGTKLLASDEVWQLVPQRKAVSQPVAMILNDGRKDEIDLAFTSQRVNRTHDEIRAVTSELVTFQHTDRLPLDWLAEYFDREQVKALKSPGGFLQRTL